MEYNPIQHSCHKSLFLKLLLWSWRTSVKHSVASSCVAGDCKPAGHLSSYPPLCWPLKTQTVDKGSLYGKLGWSFWATVETWQWKMTNCGTDPSPFVDIKSLFQGNDNTKTDPPQSFTLWLVYKGVDSFLWLCLRTYFEILQHSGVTLSGRTRDISHPGRFAFVVCQANYLLKCGFDTWAAAQFHNVAMIIALFTASPPGSDGKWHMLCNDLDSTPNPFNWCELN